MLRPNQTKKLKDFKMKYLKKKSKDKLKIKDKKKE